MCNFMLKKRKLSLKKLQRCYKKESSCVPKGHHSKSKGLSGEMQEEQLN